MIKDTLPCAVIITIGDELLLGQVVDTNSAWIGQGLAKQGIGVVQRLAVADDEPAILAAIDRALELSSLVIITGGLGPTRDDLTKAVLCRYFQSDLRMDEEVLRHIQTIFDQKGVALLPSNRDQALVPTKARTLFNRMGTAPGMWFEEGDKDVISLPGVPFEMKTILEEEVWSRLREKYSGYSVEYTTLQILGIGESYLAERIRDIEDDLPPFIHLAYLPGMGNVRLRITGCHTDAPLLQTRLASITDQIKERLGDLIAADEDISIEEAVGRLLTRQGKTLGLAESCTGGYLAHRITNIPGSSAYFKGGIVSYDNAVKTDLLAVPTKVLESEGAVSAETVCRMAENAIPLLGADLVIAVSGILGPGGGTPEKPVGTVWVALSDGKSTESRCLRLRFDRIENKERIASEAFNWLRLWLQNNPSSAKLR